MSAPGVGADHGLPKKRKHAEFSAEQLAALAPRFWSKVDRSGGPDACWTWTASLATNGYGQWYPRDGVHVPAHRFAKMLEAGSTLEFREVVMHARARKCAKSCVNPGHLVIGTHALNNLHTTAEGDGFVGVANGMAKLTEQDVIRARELVAATVGRNERAEVIRREAERLGVHEGHLRSCVIGRFWSHLPGAVVVRRRLPSRHEEVRATVAAFFAAKAEARRSPALEPAPAPLASL